MALIAPSFEGLLLGRFIQAAGLATCSVTTQTLLRDRLSGDALTRYFVTLGALRRTAVLVAGLNFLVFSFYSAGPFMTGPLPGLGFGWVGLAVAVAGLAASSWLPFHSPLPLSGAWLLVCTLLLHTHRRDHPRAPARSSS
ncbi:hypothetical protein [Achromobacter sp. UMC46]|uniref:hypothetical protein n=1 Tax=Achromobacter sp. UMC46 TaxID=1862319 RepID=UPI0021063786|nr:hypothetical protein [Achromobacter sp. UMC46]MBB1596475.1 hypothetical protein [Achromobacter sp. UMC46]